MVIRNVYSVGGSGMVIVRYPTNGYTASGYVTNASVVNGTGGTRITENGFTTHTFTSSGTFTPPTNINAEVLVVAGGGGGNGQDGYYVEGGGTGGTGIVITRYPTIFGLTAYSKSSVKTQGSYALKGIALTSSSLNKKLTRTIASPVDLSESTTLSFDIRASRTGSNIKVGIHDSGGTITEVTPNITSANVFQTATMDLSVVADADNTFFRFILTKQTTEGYCAAALRYYHPD